MAKYDYGGGCACGLQAECDCEHAGKTVPKAIIQGPNGEPDCREPFKDYREMYEETMPMSPRHPSAVKFEPPSLKGDDMNFKVPPLTAKDTNPKDAVGTRKPPMSVVPMGVMMEVGVGMLEGARKYGRHNYRIAGVRASVYVDAAMRHLIKFWDFGINIDKDSGLSEVTKAITSLVVLRDAMMTGKWVDDRPPPLSIELLDLIQKSVDDVFERYPEALPAYTHEHVKGSEEK
jgi:Domain of unknown function (DUF5664)